jgi:hypothetical protein
MSTLYKYAVGGREVTFLDAEDAYKPEDIRQHWATTFPELGQAQTEIDAKAQTVDVEGQPVAVGRVVSFVKKVGTKGAVYRVTGRYNLKHCCGCIYCDRTYEPRRITERIECEPEELEAALAEIAKGQEDELGDGDWYEAVTATLIGEDQLLRERGYQTLPEFAG